MLVPDRSQPRPTDEVGEDDAVGVVRTRLLIESAAGDQAQEGVVMVSSVTGSFVAMKGDVAYGTARAGMVGLMRALAVDVAGRG